LKTVGLSAVVVAFAAITSVAAIEIPADFQSGDVVRNQRFLITEPGATAEKVLVSSGWKPVSSVNISVSNRDVWSQFELSNPAKNEKSLIVELDASWVDRVTFYVIKQGKVATESQAGDRNPDRRVIDHRNPSFPVLILPDETVVCLTRYQATGSIYLTPRVFSEREFYLRSLLEYSGFGLYFGSLLAFGVQGFLLFLRGAPSRGQWSRLCFSAFASFSIVGCLIYTGLMQQFISAPLVANEGLIACGGLAGAFAMALIRILLETGNRPLLDRIAKFLTIAYAVEAILPVVVGYTISLSILNYTYLILFPFVIWLGVSGILRKKISAPFLLLALVSFHGSIFVEALFTIGILEPSFVIRHSFLIGNYLEIVFFAIGVGYYIGEDEKSRLATSARLGEIENAMRMARKSHARLLPADLTFPGAHFAVHYSPADDLGGDFYDFVKFNDNSFGVLMVDICGHGLGAALDASVVKIAFRSALEHSTDPATVLTFMNGRLARQMAGHYATAVYMYVNVEYKQLTYVSAGHPGPCILSQRGVRQLDEYQPLLGFAPGVEYTTYSEQIEIADTLFVFTDGLYEVIRGEDLPNEDLIALLKKMPQSISMAESIVPALTELIGSEPQIDDITMLAISLSSSGISGITDAVVPEKTEKRA